MGILSLGDFVRMLKVTPAQDWLRLLDFLLLHRAWQLEVLSLHIGNLLRLMPEQGKELWCQLCAEHLAGRFLHDEEVEVSTVHRDSHSGKLALIQSD